MDYARSKIKQEEKYFERQTKKKNLNMKNELNKRVGGRNLNPRLTKMHLNDMLKKQKQW